MKVYFFGCESPHNMGHYVFGGNGYGTYKQISDALGVSLDTGLLKEAKIPDRQGLGVFVQRGGYSIVNWWDNGGDSRPASHSAFIVEGVCDAAEVIRLGLEAFPFMTERAANIQLK